MGKIFDHILNRNLAHVTRFNNRPQHFPESVAEHSFYVAYITQVLCWLLEERKIKVDTKKALQMALIHDQEEGFSGDILNPFKHFNQKVYNAIKEVNKETIGMMFEDLPEKTAEDFVALWREETERASIESQIVKIADILSLISKCYEEIEAGNNYFSQIYKKELKNLKTLEYSWWKKIRDQVLSGAVKQA
ncbi:MAG: YfbR-like 5'-deoxynucleotidase [Candidatus Woykebacteria bacterium]